MRTSAVAIFLAVAALVVWLILSASNRSLSRKIAAWRDAPAPGEEIARLSENPGPEQVGDELAPPASEVVEERDAESQPSPWDKIADEPIIMPATPDEFATQVGDFNRKMIQTSIAGFAAGKIDRELLSAMMAAKQVPFSMARDRFEEELGNPDVAEAFVANTLIALTGHQESKAEALRGVVAKLWEEAGREGLLGSAPEDEQAAEEWNRGRRSLGESAEKQLMELVGPIYGGALRAIFDHSPEALLVPEELLDALL